MHVQLVGLGAAATRAGQSASHSMKTQSMMGMRLCAAHAVLASGSAERPAHARLLGATALEARGELWLALSAGLPWLQCRCRLRLQCGWPQCGMSDAVATPTPPLNLAAVFNCPTNMRAARMVRIMMIS